MTYLNLNRDKENIFKNTHDIVSLNGVQVWTDNKFEDDLLEEKLPVESIEEIRRPHKDPQ